MSFTDDAGNAESLTSAATTAVAAKPNTAATGLPTISGTVQVEETLTADISGIAEADGLVNVSFSYQWIRSDGNTDTDIAGKKSSTYTLVPADQGKTIKVKVSFTDDANNEETRTSEATAAVVAAPNRLPEDSLGECAAGQAQGTLPQGDRPQVGHPQEPRRKYALAETPPLRNIKSAARTPQPKTGAPA